MYNVPPLSASPTFSNLEFAGFLVPTAGTGQPVSSLWFGMLGPYRSSPVNLFLHLKIILSVLAVDLFCLLWQDWTLQSAHLPG